MQEYRRRRGPVSKAGGLGAVIAVLKRLNRRGRLILACLAIALVAAVVLICLPKGGPAQVGAIDMPVPTETYAEPTPTATPVPTTTPEVTADPTLKEGDENEDVQELQERLMELGYLDIDESTQKFGPATETAVTWFQRQEGLEQTGIADGETQAWLFAGDAKHYTLLEGFEGTDVKGLQEQLRRLGYIKKVTSYYGDETKKAVEAFQKRNKTLDGKKKLAVDGKTGEETLDVIFSPEAVPDPSVAAALRSKANIDEMIAAAKSKVGKPYVSGAEGPNSFDCSGLVYYCLKQAGSNRGRYNAAGYARISDWDDVAWKDLKRGDLMFFWSDTKNKIGHVAIYIGNGTIIDASSSNGKVVQRNCTSNWFRTMFRGAKRPW